MPLRERQDIQNMLRVVTPASSGCQNAPRCHRLALRKTENLNSAPVGFVS
jgi:hypothetical protein